MSPDIELTVSLQDGIISIKIDGLPPDSDHEEVRQLTLMLLEKALTMVEEATASMAQ